MNLVEPGPLPDPTPLSEAEPEAETVMTRPRRVLVVAAVAALVVVTLLIVTVVTVVRSTDPEPRASGAAPSRAPAASAGGTQSPVALPPPPSVSSESVSQLPAAVYDAVIPGLLAHDSADVDGITQAYTLSADAPLFGDDLGTPIARLPVLNFLDEPTTVVPVEIRGEWALVLTPARRALPSESGGYAAAQTAGWVPSQFLVPAHELPARIVISVSAQTLTVRTPEGEESFAVGIGAQGTPTPTGTAGYLQARYDDPSQADYTIQLTTLHSAAADEPFGGTDGGLIGLHYNLANTGAVSHGCVRLGYDALLAVDRLPLGTPVVLES